MYTQEFITDRGVGVAVTRRLGLFWSISIV